MTNAGVFGCDGSCTAGTPLEGLCTMSICADNEGDACVSVQNSCGQVNEGTIGCNGACSATAPAEKYCVPVVPVESVSGSSGIVETIERFREAPVTQAAVAIATPVAIVTAVSTVAVLTTSLNLLAYIQFIFTSPLMLIHRRKRKPFGIVYHAVTKVPVDLAVVRLYTADTNRLVKSAVTNAEGKYFFVVEPGQYRLSATKHDFVFPSTYLQDVKDDGVFLDVYTGQTIVVTAHDATIAANIPLDGAQGEHAQTPRGILVKKALRKLQFGLALSGSVLSALVYILAPSWLTLGLAAGQVIIFCVFVRLARVKKPKGWGVVYDATTRRPVGKAIVRLFEPKYNKLVETTITDSLGRYSFLVGANEYFMRTSKDGYGEHTVNTIDYRQHTEPLPLAVDVPLTPEKPL